MKFQIALENLQKNIPNVTHAVSQRSQLPILSNFLLEALKGKLRMSATDLEIGVIITIPATVEEEGVVTVPAKTFSELISSLPSGTIHLESNEGKLEVKSSKSKSVFQTLAPEEFPTLYEEKGDELATLSEESLQADFSKVVFAASSDIGRPALSGVLIEKEKDGFLLVATDGYRLSLKHNGLKTSPKTELEKPIIVPARVIREVVLMKQSGDIVVYVSKKNNQVLFAQQETEVIGRLIDAEFPNYKKIIPTDSETTVSFDRAELQKAVKICSIFARESANIIKLSFKKDSMIVSANTPSVGENTVEIEAQTKGEENEIAFNSRYVLEFLSNVDSDELVFEMTGPLNPGVFKIKGDDSFLHLIMPIRVQSE